jgi:ABC-type bacteriocin/lantibiotic exporter with double-glycine peptidase domain
MESVSRLIIGLFFIIVGIALIIVCFFITFFFLIYAIPLLIIGIVIIFNKNEDKIEKRKDLKEKEYKK